MKSKQPALFVGHGSPMNAIEDSVYRSNWKKLGSYLEESYEKPRAIVVFSAHFAAKETVIIARKELEQIYDMYGFPEELYQVRYPAFGNPEIAHMLAKRFEDAQVRYFVDDSSGAKAVWGDDHGIWSVLTALFPKADVPLVIVSTKVAGDSDTELTRQAYAIGKAAKELREQGMLVMGTGNVVHNLGAYQRGFAMQHEGKAFDDALEYVLYKRNEKALLNWQSLPHSDLAAPTLDHFLPIVSSYAATDAGDTLKTFTKEHNFGPISMTSYIWE